MTYLPWSDLDLAELRKVSAIAQDFEDPDGLLRLTDKQKGHFSGWLRPFDISDSPKMISLISSLSIKQVRTCMYVCMYVYMCVKTRKKSTLSSHLLCMYIRYKSK